MSPEDVVPGFDPAEFSQAGRVPCVEAVDFLQRLEYAGRLPQLLLAQVSSRPLTNLLDSPCIHVSMIAGLPSRPQDGLGRGGAQMRLIVLCPKHNFVPRKTGWTAMVATRVSVKEVFPPRRQIQISREPYFPGWANVTRIWPN